MEIMNEMVAICWSKKEKEVLLKNAVAILRYHPG